MFHADNELFDTRTRMTRAETLSMHPLFHTMRRDQRTRVLRAALLSPRNLMVLGIGGAAGGIAWYAIPFGILAYGLLCYIDLHSEEFIASVLPPEQSESPAHEQLYAFSADELAQSIEAGDLRRLDENIRASQEKIHRLRTQSDPMMQHLLRDLSSIDSLVERSQAFLYKAQTLRNYLRSENIPKIERELEGLEAKVRDVSDEFSQRQYAQALQARQSHLAALAEIRRIDERLTSQLTNIALSLDSLYSRMMKLKSADYSFQDAESEHLSEQLTSLLNDVELLDDALSRNMGFD